MASLRGQLTPIVESAFAEAGLDRHYGTVTRSDRPDLGQFQCNGALAAAKAARANPRDIGTRVAAILAADPIFTDVSLAGPGFINLTMTDVWLAGAVAAQAQDPRLGVHPAPEPHTIIVDYGGPNVAKPMHIGHLRAAIIGESIKRIARFLGHKVWGDVHLGDWGLQMGMLISEMAIRHPELPYFDADHDGPYPAESPVTIGDLERLYPEAAAQAKADATRMEAARRATLELQAGHRGYRALWRHFVDVSVVELKRDYERLGVEFDLWLGESDTADRLPDLVARLKREGLAYESEGALVMDVAEPGDKQEIPPLMLEKSDGAVLYGTTDLATLEQRMADYQADEIIYVVDNRQADHFRQVFRAARRADIVPEDTHLTHAGFGTMNGPDGRPFKTREGGVMRLTDLMDMVTRKAEERLAELEVAKDYPEPEGDRVAHLVAMATLKYADLMNHRTKDYVFDVDRFSAFEGRTGPYLLYAAVRVKSILRKAEDLGVTVGESIQPPASAEERELMLTIGVLPDVVAAALDGRAPNHLCEYGHTLATVFNRFYHEHHILREADAARQASWLCLAQTVARELEQVLYLLGIDVPDRM